MKNKTYKFSANAPGPHAEMTNRVKKLFERDARIHTTTIVQYEELKKDVLAVINEYDISKAMRSFDKEDK